MASQKSIDNAEPQVRIAEARMPKRKRGHARVSQLIAAATVVFDEKGYKAATMTEIAARAEAPIGSLYQFFPNKDLLADAIVARYGEHLNEALDAIAARAEVMSARQLSDAILGVLVDLSRERRVALSLLDIRWELPERRPGQFRQALRWRIAAIVGRWAPALDEETRQLMGVMLHQAMKSLVQLHDDLDFAEKSRAIAAWRDLFASYLEAQARIATVNPAAPGLEDRYGME